MSVVAVKSNATAFTSRLSDPSIKVLSASHAMPEVGLEVRSVCGVAVGTLVRFGAIVSFTGGSVGLTVAGAAEEFELLALGALLIDGD
jgi:hypothetical protein